MSREEVKSVHLSKGHLVMHLPMQGSPKMKHVKPIKKFNKQLFWSNPCG